MGGRSTAIFTLLLVLAPNANPIRAGQLFPPKNVDGTTSCPSDTSLVWSTVGSDRQVECISTSSMVTVPNCPSGQYLVGVKNGVAVCEAAAAPSAILCSYSAKMGNSNSYYNNPAYGGYGSVWGGNTIKHKFTEAECGGTLPDSTYTASLYKLNGSCLVQNSTTIYQPKDKSDFYPGVYLTFTNCAGDVEVGVAYIKTSTGGK